GPGPQEAPGIARLSGGPPRLRGAAPGPGPRRDGERRLHVKAPGRLAGTGLPPHSGGEAGLRNAGPSPARKHRLPRARRGRRRYPEQVIVPYREAAAMLLRQVTVENFRGIKKVTVDLDETTVLIGENNSGKTSFIDALRLSTDKGLARRGNPFDDYDH